MLLKNKVLEKIVFLTGLILICSLVFYSDLSLAKKRHHKQVSTHSSRHAAIATPIANDLPLAEAISGIVNKYDANVNIGVEIQSLSDNKIIYQHNANHLFRPASSLKIFTATAALLNLGSDYQFKTLAFAKQNALQNGVLNGDLYFYFDGDPTLKRQVLNELIADLKKAGVQRITGNVYIDNSIFDLSSYGPGWMWDEKNFCYAAPTNAIMLDKNCFPFRMNATKENHPVQVSSVLDDSFMPIVSNAITRRAASDDCPVDLRVSDDNKYYLSGCIWPSSSPITLVVAVKNIRLYAMNVINKSLAANGIAVDGKIKFSRVPENYVILAGKSSAPLKDLVKEMLKKSDNLIADALYKKLGNNIYHRPATWKNSGKALESILEKNARIDFTDTSIVDGSGLSHYNLISPAKMVELLNFAYRTPAVKDSFYDALPISGMNGTLAYRMGTSDLRGRIHAKTGTMKSITSLVGYVTTVNNKIISFAIIINDYIGKPAKYRQIEDAICSYLARRAI